jgi:hypothetical protein
MAFALNRKMDFLKCLQLNQALKLKAAKLNLKCKPITNTAKLIAVLYIDIKKSSFRDDFRLDFPR